MVQQNGSDGGHHDSVRRCSTRSGTSIRWPSKGEIEFCGTYMRYRADLPLTLRGVTLRIPGGTSLGICGRTGSGKSSLFNALLRIVRPCAAPTKEEGGEGGLTTPTTSDSTISIDGRWTNEVGLHRLRRNLMVIPQEPVIFSGSLRFNLDPFEEHTDDEILKALKVAHLQHKFQQQKIGHGQNGQKNCIHLTDSEMYAGGGRGG